MIARGDLPDFAPGRPLWLVTLADLALLLVGFFVLLQASQLDRAALSQGIRQGFRVSAPADAMAVSAGVAGGFARGSAVLPAAPAGLLGWAREAVRDGRVTLRLAGAVDGTADDVDPATHSGAVLAADRARAVAVALIDAGLPSERLTLTTAARPGRRGVTVTTIYSGAVASDRPK